MSQIPVRRALVIAAVVVGVAATTSGIVYAATAGSPTAGHPAAAADQTTAAITATKTSAAPSSDDQALKSAKSAQQPAADGQKAASAAGQGGNLLSVPRAAGLVAANLGVSTDAAARALAALLPLSNEKGGLDPASAEFTAVATGLGVSPQRLADAITALKLGMR